jgi:hypothetical protein
MRSRDTDQMIRVSKAMKDIKERGHVREVPTYLVRR